MLGRYENFPATIHKKAFFTTLLSTKTLQQKLVRILHSINGKTYNLEDVAAPSVPDCNVIFECGIAESTNFNYIDKEETSKVLKTLRKKPFQTMDFFLAVRYYKAQNEKKTPLRFDYYMVRFIFNINAVEVQVSHERGPRYMSPQDIVDFLAHIVNEASSKKVLKASGLS